MKKTILQGLITMSFLFVSLITYAQAPVLGTARNFVIFSTNGDISNNGSSHLTGNVGTNNGSSTAFGNVNGSMHDQDTGSAHAATDLLAAYTQLNAMIPTSFHAPLLGNGTTFSAGIHSVPASATLNGELILDAQDDPNALFVIQVEGALATAAASKITLLNGAAACNVFWKIEGALNMAAGTIMKGTIIVNNAAISMSSMTSLEGRALTTGGAITLDGVLAYTPVGCGSPLLTGPAAPNLRSAACYSIFSSNGAVTNTGISTIKGDVGSNNGSATGYDPAMINGTLHPIPDGSTAQCAADLLLAYNEIHLIPHDIELLYPAQFGNNLVLTPHTYIMNCAATFTDTLYLDGAGNENAVFVIQINGALSTSTYANVVLINGTKAENVYWKVEGAVTINNYSVFNGTIICNNGALGAINTGVKLNGRSLTTNGALSTTAIAATLDKVCISTGVHVSDTASVQVNIYPNPFVHALNFTIKNTNFSAYELKLFTLDGKEVLSQIITDPSGQVEINHLASGMYFYRLLADQVIIQSGKIIRQE